MAHSYHMLQYVRQLKLTNHDGNIFYLETLYALCGRAFADTDKSLPDHTEYVEALLFEIRRRFPVVKRVEFLASDSGVVDLTEAHNAALGMQALWRSYRARRMLRSVALQSLAQHRRAQQGRWSSRLSAPFRCLARVFQQQPPAEVERAGMNDVVVAAEAEAEAAVAEEAL